jgi:hypothetical protein
VNLGPTKLHLVLSDIIYWTARVCIRDDNCASFLLSADISSCIRDGTYASFLLFTDFSSLF